MSDTPLDALVADLASPEVATMVHQIRQSAPELTRILQRVEVLGRSGAVDTVLDLVDVAHAARVSMSDAMISHLADSVRVVAELLDVLMTSGLPDRAPALLNATIAARDAAIADRQFLSPLNVLMAPQEPELQFVLKFMLALARRLPAAMQEDQQATVGG